MLWTVTAAAIVAGLLIGLTGIGGVLIVPALTEFGGMPVDRAIAASSVSFVFAGSLAAFLHLRGARVERGPVWTLCISGGTGALLGALSVQWLPVLWLRLGIAGLALVSGAHALTVRHVHARGTPPNPALAGIGLLVGYCSAVSGTGGPVMLIPILLALRTPIQAAVTLALVIQIPIVFISAGTYAWQGRVDPALGLVLGVLISAGTLAGVFAGRRLSSPALTLVVGLMLVALGAWYGYLTLATTRPLSSASVGAMQYDQSRRTAGSHSASCGNASTSSSPTICSTMNCIMPL